MSAPPGNWHTGRRRHVRLCREQVWGRCPDSPDWLAVPLLADGFAARASAANFSPRTRFGGWRRSLILRDGLVVAGSFDALLWPQATGALLAMALERTEGELNSYCMDYYTPADPRRLSGLVADSLELRARPGRTGVRLRLELLGRSEGTNPSLTEADFDYSGLSAVPFSFDRAQINLDGAPVTGVEHVVLGVTNAVAAGPLRGGNVAFLAAGRRAVSLRLVKLDDSNAFSEALRTDGVLTFEMTLAHPEGHVLTMRLPALHPEAAEEHAPPALLARTELRMSASTDEAGDDFTYELQLNS